MTGGDDDASPDAGGGGSGSGGGGTAELYPMKVGNQWMFDVAAVGANYVCTAGTYGQKVLSANPVLGRDAFQVTSFCTGAAGPYDYAAVGDTEIDFNYNGSWLTLIDPTLTDGHSWTYFNTSYTWKRETSITVPAGTYSDCWTAVQNVSYTAYLTYCRGVGLVRSYSSDLGGNGWDAKLTAFTPG